MANATPSRFGQIQGAGATDALWLDIFGGEVLTAFETKVQTKDRIRTRTITEGKSARFPATFKAHTQYHTPGVEIAGQTIQSNEVTVTLDDLLISPVEISEIDELKSHFDVRAPYSAELGNSMALAYDRVVTQCLLAAARGAALFADDDAGGAVIETDVAAGASFSTSGSDLIDGVNLAKQALDEKDVPVENGVSALFLPAQWYLMARTDHNINQFYGGQSTLAHQVLTTVSDIQIVKSNAPLFGKDVTPYDAGTNADGLVGAPSGKYQLPAGFATKYQGDNTKTVGVVWTEAAAAMLQLMGLKMESEWDARRQVTFMLAKMAIGAGPLRSKCAIELKTA